MIPKQLMILLSLFIVCIALVSATDICLEPITPNSTCYLVTPTLYCITPYEYLLYDNNGILLESGNMSVFEQAMQTYYFNFSEDVGTYYITICDGSTRQVKVEGDTMIGLTGQTWIFIILILLFILFMVLAFTVSPLFMMIDGFIFGYFAFYTYSALGNIFVLILMSLVSVAFIFIGLLIPIKES